MAEKCRCCKSTQGQIEFHHPVKAQPDLGLYLCQPCHSILQGRKTRYVFESGVDRTSESQRADMLAWVADQLGIPMATMDKH